MRRSILLMVGLHYVAGLFAQQVSPSEARRKAGSFVLERQTRGSTGLDAEVRPVFRGGASDEAPAYYAFNVGRQRGFVIVSGDSRTPEILAYADSGALTPDDMPDAMAMLLQSYRSEIRGLRRASRRSGALPTAGNGNSGESGGERHAVAPLVKAQWNQLWPYNLQCPRAGGRPMPTGCVATAMAQVMHAQRCPMQQSVRPIPADRYERQRTGSNVMPRLPFRWDQMTDHYDAHSSRAAIQAVAYLMRQCGATVKTDYGAIVSSAADSHIVPAMVGYFGYDADAFTAVRDDYTVEAWNELIYQEVAAGRPVIYIATSPTDGAHAFVCDGYRQGDYFHINWGWGGSRNGFFRLSVLNGYAPEGWGNSEGYTLFHSAVVGLQPENGRVDRPVVRVADLTFDQTLIVRASAEQDFPRLACTLTLRNGLPHPQQVEVGLGLYVDGRLEQMVYEHTCALSPNEETAAQHIVLKPLDCLSGLAECTAAIVPMCRKVGNATWHKMANADAFVYVLTMGERTMRIMRDDMPQAKPRLNILQVEMVGTKEVGSDKAVRATISNTGGSFSGPLYLRVDGKVYGYAGVYLAAGATDRVAFTFAPSQAGRYAITIELADGTRLYQGTIDVTPTSLAPGHAIEPAPEDRGASPAPWFSLDGMRIGVPTKAGVYIFKGRKFVVSSPG